LKVAVLPFSEATFNVFVETERVAAPANWVTVTVCEVTPLPEIVTVAVRVVVVGFASAVTVTVPLPVPFAGLTESQVWLEATVQLIFEVTLNVAVLPFAAATFSVFVEIESVAAPANWVTVTVCEVTPLPETVTVAVRVEVVGLACAVTVTVPLPVPFAGFIESQVWLETAVQLIFDVTLNEAVLPFAAATFKVFVETARVDEVPADWVTVTVFEATPIAEIVTTAVRADKVVFCCAVKVIFRFPLSEARLAVNHAWFDETIQLVLE